LSATDDPQVKQALEELKKYPGTVDLIMGSLPPQQYVEVLHRADIVLLPYDALRYRSRSSGVLAEALKLGRPTVIPEGTWMARVAGASGVVFSGNGDSARFVEAVDAAINRFPALQAEAARLSHSWQEMATPAAVYEAVLSAE